MTYQSRLRLAYDVLGDTRGLGYRGIGAWFYHQLRGTPGQCSRVSAWRYLTGVREMPAEVEQQITRLESEAIARLEAQAEAMR